MKFEDILNSDFSELLEMKDDLASPNFKDIFLKFGGFRKFLSSVGANETEVKLWVSNGIIPEKWKTKIKKMMDKL